MAQNNDSPGKRLKREEKKNTLYVSRPDDPRLQMYQDSLALHNIFAGTNPIEINKTFDESFTKDIKSTPRKNYAPLKTGPYGSALSKVIKTSTPPLNNSNLLGSRGFENAPASYGLAINFPDPNSALTSVSPAASLIAEDEARKKMNIKRNFAPIGYQSVEHYDPWFVGHYFTKDASGKRLLEKTPQLENSMTPQQVRAVYPKITDKELNEIISRATSAQGSYAVIGRNGEIIQVNKQGNPNAVRSEGISFSPTKEYMTSPIYAKPQREVIFRPNEPVEPLATRQATITPSEIVPPVVRPVPQSNIGPQDGPMGFALRYPAQTLMNRVKARITGTPNMPYWVDREGVKRYPSMGENSPEEVRMMETLRSGLDSNSPEDVSELKRIEMLRKMSSKDRRKYMDSERIAQE